MYTAHAGVQWLICNVVCFSSSIVRTWLEEKWSTFLISLSMHIQMLDYSEASPGASQLSLLRPSRCTCHIAGVDDWHISMATPRFDHPVQTCTLDWPSDECRNVDVVWRSQGISFQSKDLCKFVDWRSKTRLPRRRWCSCKMAWFPAVLCWLRTTETSGGKRALPRKYLCQ